MSYEEKKKFTVIGTGCGPIAFLDVAGLVADPKEEVDGGYYR